MRKRGDVTVEEVVVESRKPNGSDDMRAIDNAEKPRTEAEVAVRLPVHALERYADFSPGDSIGITLGAELYSPVKYNTFTVGPFSATVVVRPGETGADAAMRCYRVLLELNEAEFNIAWGRQRERLTKMNGKH